MQNFEDVIYQNPEPYNSIYEFIKSTVLGKYPCLTSCYQSNFDEEGIPKVQYYIRYAADLTLEQWHRLRNMIKEDILKFCLNSGISHDLYTEIDFIVTVDGDYYLRTGKGF